MEKHKERLYGRQLGAVVDEVHHGPESQFGATNHEEPTHYPRHKSQS
jgi:hypothetical protein